jgi:hypothetical protein
MGDDGTLRERLLETMEARELQERMALMESETGGLFDDGAILALIADELGLTRQHFSNLAALSPDAPVFVECMIDSIEPPRTFSGRDRSGRLRRLQVSDKSATMILMLWDEETELVEKMHLHPGSKIRILSAILRMTRYGPQIHVGRNGFIVPMGPAADAGPLPERHVKDLDSGRVIVKGVLLSFAISGRGIHRSARGRFYDGTGETDVIFAEYLIETLSGAGVGTELELSEAKIVSQDGHKHLLCDERTRVRIL